MGWAGNRRGARSGARGDGPDRAGRGWTGQPARSRNNNEIAKLLECVTLEGVREHQRAFQDIADANGGNRFSGLPGHDASVAYVVERLEAAGYDPVVQPFDYLAFDELGPSALQQMAPNAVTYVQGRRLRRGHAVRSR